MENFDIYSDISRRTNGDIYIGVVGPVRTGKSTFIKNFMSTLVMPQIADENTRLRTMDELPQSGSGKTIMTTEPKFVPNEAVKVTLGDNAQLKVRLIDCVGYIVKDALGYMEDGNNRMVKTPWSESPMPFQEAAEKGTKKVICDHSTIGILVTTDGSICELPRSAYVDAEERVANELNAINKPYIIIVNTVTPDSVSTKDLCYELSEKYGVTALAANVEKMSEREIKSILEAILLEFPIKELRIDIPTWIEAIPNENPVKDGIYKCIISAASDVTKISEVSKVAQRISECEFVNAVTVESSDLAMGISEIKADVDRELFYDLLSKQCGLDIKDDTELVKILCEMSALKQKYEKFCGALEQVEATGYGIVTPTLSDMQLDEPEIIKQGSKYGVKLSATAPSIHMIRADIRTEVSPIVGSEEQSNDLIKYLFADYESDPSKIWDSNIFGKSLHQLMGEGLHSKLERMPQETRDKLQLTLERMINDGCNRLICFIL